MIGWGPGAPSRLTAPLSPNYTTDADWFLPIVRQAWKIAYPGFDLDDWQVELIRRCLETYPAGHARAGDLRFRQVVISLARQNGKSVIGAILGLYGLLRDQAEALVIGLASSSEQARIIYERTLHVINANAALRARFARLTDTRGIRTKLGGKYEIKASKAAALQGLAITLGMVDELHLLAAALWNALVSGTGGRDGGIVVGITTAGDDNSELLIQLYATGEKAIAGDPELDRFGFFVWEAPESRRPTDRDELIEFLNAANPSLAEGRIDLENVLSDLASMPDTEVIRYRLNRFVDASGAFISSDAWIRRRRPDGISFPAGRPVFAIDRTPDWGFAAIVAGIKTADEIVHTELVAAITKPTISQLATLCDTLARFDPVTFIMDGYAMKDLAFELRRRGHTVTIATQGDVINASALLFAKIATSKLTHAGDDLLSMQIPRTIRKNVGEAFRISRKDSSVEIDAVMATALAVLAAETRTEATLQMF